MDAIAVVNAGSWSIKFTLFGMHGDDLMLTVLGQAEALYTALRFLAKDAGGRVLEEKSWGHGVALGHEGALDHLLASVRGALARLR